MLVNRVHTEKETVTGIIMRIRTNRTLRCLRLPLVVLVAAGIMVGTAHAQEAEVTANAGWVSQYYYRGLLQKTSSASAGLDVAFGALSLGTWLADVGDGAEIDLFGSVGGEVEGLSLSAGGTAYLYTGEFDDTYLEANLGAGYGPLSLEFSIGQYDNFGGPTLDYWFVGVTAEHEGFFGTVGGFGSDFSGNYGEVGYGFSAAELDFSISGILNDSDLSGLVDGDDEPTPGLTLVFGIGKTFSIK